MKRYNHKQYPMEMIEDNNGYWIKYDDFALYEKHMTNTISRKNVDLKLKEDYEREISICRKIMDTRLDEIIDLSHKYRTITMAFIGYIAISFSTVFIILTTK